MGFGGQNGQIPSVLEIFCPKTLFRNNIVIYHFLWYSSLVSSSTIFFNPTWLDDMESLIKKINNKKFGHLVPELGGLEYCSWYPSPSSSGTILGRLLFPCVQSFPFSFTVLACFCLIFGYLNSSSLIGVEITLLFNFHL